ncbi:uncharacterized protein FFFS_11965 [Fusarium fujikuroi]|nr:uncharacterized protein FFFS_11965 [Fusarium fujikuroi]
MVGVLNSIMSLND